MFICNDQLICLIYPYPQPTMQRYNHMNDRYFLLILPYNHDTSSNPYSDSRSNVANDIHEHRRFLYLDSLLDT